MFNIRIVTALLIIASPPLAHAGLWDCIRSLTNQNVTLPNLTSSHANEIARVGDEINRRFRPTEYIYLFVGRSPTPLLAYFELRNLNAFNIPLTGFKNRPRDPAWTGEVWGETAPLPSEREKILFSHFSKYLPATTAGKKVLLIDFTAYGDRLSAALLYLRAYYAKHDSTVILEPFALPLVPTLPRPYHVPDERHILRVKTQTLIQAMKQEKYEPFAKYGAYRLGQDESPTTINPDYIVFKEALARRLRITLN